MPKTKIRSGALWGPPQHWGCSYLGWCHGWLLAVGYSEGPTLWFFIGSGGYRAGHFWMDAAWDAGCPSNSCYGKHFSGKISSHIHVSVIVFWSVPGIQAQAARHQAGSTAPVAGLAFPGMGKCWRTPKWGFRGAQWVCVGWGEQVSSAVPG